MILTELENVTVYRMHVPKWAVKPTSGDGAKKYGGRANRPGIAAIYLSLSIETAVKEYQQTSILLPPGTLVSYQVSIKSLVDFRAGFTPSWGPIWEDFYCDWRELWFNQKIEPPSWVIGDEVVSSVGAKGILFRSTVNDGGTNLVVYIDKLSESDSLLPFDPKQSLSELRASAAHQ